MTDHVLRYSPLRYFNTQLEQLAVYAGRAPAWIGKTHPADQIPDLLGYRRSAVRKSALPSPVEAKALAVPCDDGFRFHDQEGRAQDLTLEKLRKKLPMSWAEQRMILLPAAQRPGRIN